MDKSPPQKPRRSHKSKHPANSPHNQQIQTQNHRQNLTYELPAPPVTRFYAFLIDFFITAIPFNGLYGLTYNLLPAGIPFFLHDLLYWPLFGLATTFFTARLGATLGKKIMKLKAVQHHSTPLTAYQFFLRETLIIYGFTSFYTLILILMISGLNPEYLGGLNFFYIPGFIVGAGFLLIFIRPPGAPLHDRIFNTGVLIASLKKG